MTAALTAINAAKGGRNAGFVNHIKCGVFGLSQKLLVLIECHLSVRGFTNPPISQALAAREKAAECHLADFEQNTI